MLKKKLAGIIHSSKSLSKSFYTVYVKQNIFHKKFKYMIFHVQIYTFSTQSFHMALKVVFCYFWCPMKEYLKIFVCPIYSFWLTLFLQVWILGQDFAFTNLLSKWAFKLIRLFFQSAMHLTHWLSFSCLISSLSGGIP